VFGFLIGKGFLIIPVICNFN